MAETKQTTAGAIKQGNYLLINNAPCIVKSIQISKTGKHGHAKCRIEAEGMIDGQKRVEIYPSHDKVFVPIVEKKNATVLSISNEVATVMDSESFETFEIKIPEEFKGKVSEGGKISYWIIMDEKVIKDIK